MRNRTETKIVLTFIRHGKTLANEQGRYLGWTQEDLSALGRQEILQNMQKGMYPRADVLLVSPMSRCKQTAALIYPGQSWVEVDDWKEMNFGRFEGKNYQELNGDIQYQAWIDSGGTLPFPEGESREAFVERCAQAMRKLAPELVRMAQGRPKLAVTAVVHGGTIMALMSTFAGGDYFDYQCKNGACRCIEWTVSKLSSNVTVS